MNDRLAFQSGEGKAAMSQCFKCLNRLDNNENKYMCNKYKEIPLRVLANVIKCDMCRYDD